MKVKYQAFASKSFKGFKKTGDETNRPGLSGKSGKKKDTLVVNQKIATAAKNKRFSDCLHLFAEMKKTGHIPTKHTYTNLINGAVRCGRMREAAEFYSELTSKLSFCVEAATALLKGYFDICALDEAEKLWKDILTQTTAVVGSRTLDTYLRGCLYNGLVENAKHAFESDKVEKSSSSFEMYHKLLCMSGVNPGPLSGYTESSSHASHLAVAKLLLLTGSKEQALPVLDRAEELLKRATTETEDKFTKHKLNEQIREIRNLRVSRPNIQDPRSRVFLAKGLESLASALNFSGGSAIDVGARLSQRTATNCVLEVCSGVGEWIVELAKRNPNRIYFASEIRVDRCYEIMVKMFAEEVHNLFILCGDINMFLPHIPQLSFSDIHINFPEPPAWHENRTDSEGDLLTADFLKSVVLLKEQNGRLSILSDNKPYMETVARRAGNVRISRQRSDGSSYFDRMFGKKHDRYEIVL